MKATEKVHVLQEKALELGRRWSPTLGAYPQDIVDLIIFHKLHLAMPMAAAIRGFRRLKESFVDWNEVRVSTVREIQEELPAAEDSLHLAVFIKDFLEFIHRQHQTISLEFLVEQNLGEIRKYLRQVRGLDSSTVSLVLRLRKEYPVLPLDRAMEAVLARIGIFRHAENRDRKERILHDMVEPTKALFVHHFLLNHSREFCPPDDAEVDCPHCCMKRICKFRPPASSRSRTNGAAKNSRSVTEIAPRNSTRK